MKVSRTPCLVWTFSILLDNSMLAIYMVLLLSSAVALAVAVILGMNQVGLTFKQPANECIIVHS